MTALIKRQSAKLNFRPSRSPESGISTRRPPLFSRSGKTIDGTTLRSGVEPAQEGKAGRWVNIDATLAVNDRKHGHSYSFFPACPISGYSSGLSIGSQEACAA